MSIYGGFGTRKTEHSYNKNLYGLLLLMQQRICEEYYPEAFKLFNDPKQPPKSLDHQSFLVAFRKILCRMVMMEEHK